MKSKIILLRVPGKKQRFQRNFLVDFVHNTVKVITINLRIKKYKEAEI